MSNLTYSPNEVRLMQYAEKIFAPLIHEGVFDNLERVFSALLLDYIDRQIALYKNKNNDLEARHQQSFDDFTASLKNRATPEQEEVWMDWEAARTFLRKWQTIRKQVTDNGIA
ncbi:MAG: hypothetical protein HZB17_00105 [Chloroflexi bacterium]|nr:hypothetical protein [Chloroflexota bacterium]